jgi:hypothetical protein
MPAEKFISKFYFEAKVKRKSAQPGCKLRRASNPFATAAQPFKNVIDTVGQKSVG